MFISSSIIPQKECSCAWHMYFSWEKNNRKGPENEINLLCTCVKHPANEISERLSLSLFFVLNSVRSFHWRIYVGTAPVFLSLYMSVYLSVSITVSACLSVCQSACLPACLSVCLSVSLFLCLCPSECLLVFLSVSWSVGQGINQPVNSCMSVIQSISWSIHLF